MGLSAFHLQFQIHHPISQLVVLSMEKQVYLMVHLWNGMGPASHLRKLAVTWLNVRAINNIQEFQCGVLWTSCIWFWSWWLSFLNAIQAVKAKASGIWIDERIQYPTPHGSNGIILCTNQRNIMTNLQNFTCSSYKKITLFYHSAPRFFSDTTREIPLNSTTMKMTQKMKNIRKEARTNMAWFSVNLLISPCAHN